MPTRLGFLHIVALIICAGSLMQTQVFAQGAPVITVSGTSTVRDWSCPGQAAVAVTPSTSATPAPGFPTGVQQVTVKAPVKAIDCGDKTMHEHLRKALKEKDFPEIVYQLEQYTLTGTDTATTSGKITIAGVTRPITFAVKLVDTGKGMRSQGETEIDMTEFNVTPPTLFFGTLKVAKTIRVKFDAPLQPAQ